MLKLKDGYSPETIQRLHDLGLKEYQPQPIQDAINPHSQTYKLTSFIIFGICLFGRHKAVQHNSPRILWSITACSIPYYSMCSRGKLDNQDNLLGKRKSLEDNLEFNPVTRRAWSEAIKLNQQYQDQLRQEIEELKKQSIV